MEKQRKSGITLIALVITIIILLILAGITINLTVGQRGILNRAQEAGKSYKESEIREKIELVLLDLQTEVIFHNTDLTVEYALNQLKEKEILEEIDQEEQTGIIGDYIITLGNDENGNVIIQDISLDGQARIQAKILTKGYTNGLVEIAISVKTNGESVSSIKVAEGMKPKAGVEGIYEVESNGSYLVQAVLDSGVTVEKEIKINVIDKLPPKDFEIKATLKEERIEIVGETEDAEANNGNVCSGIQRYEYYVNGTKYDTQPIEGLQGDNYVVYMIAYDKAGNQVKSSEKEVGAVLLYDGSNRLPTSLWKFEPPAGIPWTANNGTMGISAIGNAVVEGMPNLYLARATTIQTYDLSQYESLTITINSHRFGFNGKLVLGIKNEAGEWMVQKTPEANGELVFDLRDINGNGKICIEVNTSEIYLSRIALE